MKFKTTAAYVSGGMCGAIWWPAGQVCGKPIRANLRGPFGIMGRFTTPASFRDALLSVLTRDGGDFQNAEFTADTVIRIERRAIDAPGKYRVHVKEIEIARLAPDLVNAEHFVGDFLGDE